MLPSDKSRRDIVQWLIIGFGGLVIALIIIGFINIIGPFIRARSDLGKGMTSTGASQHTSACRGCLTWLDNNKSFYLTIGTQALLSLPKSSYDRSKIVILSQPEGVLEITDIAGTVTDWRIAVFGKTKGVAELSVISTDPTVSDYHIIIEVR